MKTRRLLLASSLMVFNVITPLVFAEVKIEEKDVGPMAQDAQYVVSEHGGHVAARATRAAGLQSPWTVSPGRSSMRSGR